MSMSPANAPPKHDDRSLEVSSPILKCRSPGPLSAHLAHLENRCTACRFSKHASSSSPAERTTMKPVPPPCKLCVLPDRMQFSSGTFHAAPDAWAGSESRV